jgi:hypothetical protein
MSQRLFKRAIGHVTRKGLLRLLATVVSVLFIQPAWADAKVEDQKREIVLANAVQTPAAGQPLISLLNSKGRGA